MPVILALPGNEALAAHVAASMGADLASAEFRQFPDGETYVRIDTPVSGRAVIIAGTLRRPDPQFLPLAFAAATARDLGATKVGLVCPYLAYLRQDKQFKPGEALTSRQFAALLQRSVDWLVTVDPHLHRIRALPEIYDIPTQVVEAAPYLAAWIKDNVAKPILIGPDSESEQWVNSVAARIGAPYVILSKKRFGDRAVEISVPDLGGHAHHTPVILDDILSTGRTMIEAVRQLVRAGARAPICVAVHAVFADNVPQDLLRAGAAAIVTTNSIPHPTNAIDLTPGLALAAAGLT